MFSTDVFINLNNKFLKEIISKLIQSILTLFLWMLELVIENKLMKDYIQIFLFPQNATTVNILSRLKFMIFTASKIFPWKGSSPVSQSVSIFERRCYLNPPIFLSWGCFLICTSTFCTAIQLLNIVCADRVFVFPLYLLD